MTSAGICKPTPAQRQWLELEYGLFVHYGPNTLRCISWGDGTFPAEQMDFGAVDTDQWARVAKEAGMRYAVLTAKHHDGFCLWPSAGTEYCVRNTVTKVDVVKRFCDSFRRVGLGVGIYYSLWDCHCACYPDDAAYAQFMRDQLTELLTQYGTMVEVWFDGGWDKDHPTRKWPFDPAWENDPRSGYTPGNRWEWKSIYELIHRLQPDCLVMNNSSSNRPGVPRYFPIDVRTCEHLDFVWQGQLLRPTTRTEWVDPCGTRRFLPLEVEATMNPEWFWTGREYRQPSAVTLAEWRRRARLFGGNLLLNLGPAKSGVLPDCMIDPLIEARQIFETKDSIDVSHSKEGPEGST